jgi:hypothetical protein
MKKTLLICVALVIGVANTAYSIPVQDYDAGKTDALILEKSVTPLDFTLGANTSVSFEALSGTQLASANNTAFANWTPNWFNRPSWFNRPDWSTFHYDLSSFFTKKDKKNNPGGPTATVPEPGTILLLGSALIGLACISRKRMKS